MADYWVNNQAQANGDHEVHVAGCSWMPCLGRLGLEGDRGTSCTLHSKENSLKTRSGVGWVHVFF